MVLRPQQGPRPEGECCRAGGKPIWRVSLVGHGALVYTLSPCEVGAEGAFRQTQEGFSWTKGVGGWELRVKAETRGEAAIIVQVRSAGGWDSGGSNGRREKEVDAGYIFSSFKTFY